MDISRRGVLSVLGAGLGSVGLGAASSMNNSTSENEQDDKGDSTEKGDKSDANENEKNENEKNENEKNENEKNENEASDGNDHAEKNEGADNGNVGSVKLSQQEAEQIATQKVGGGSVQRVELEIEDAPKYSGTPVYNVVVKTNSGAIKEVTLNANTGDVLFVVNGA